jgi:hypothetical protein
MGKKDKGKKEAKKPKKQKPVDTVATESEAN